MADWTDTQAYEHLLAPYIPNLEVDRLYRSPAPLRPSGEPDIHPSFKLYGRTLADGTEEYFWKDFGLTNQVGYRPLHLAKYFWAEWLAKFDPEDHNSQAWARLCRELEGNPARTRTDWAIKDTDDYGVRLHPLTYTEIQWWADYGVSKATLRHHMVYGVTAFYKNGEPVCGSSYTRPVFAYVIDPYDKVVKIYRPYPKAFWTRNIKDAIEGWAQLPWRGEFLMIVSGTKDGLVTYEAGVPWIAPSNEAAKKAILTLLPTLTKRFRHICVLYDNDSTGISAMANLCAEAQNLDVTIHPISLDWPLIWDQGKLRAANDPAEIALHYTVQVYADLLWNCLYPIKHTA